MKLVAPAHQLLKQTEPFLKKEKTQGLKDEHVTLWTRTKIVQSINT